MAMKKLNSVNNFDFSSAYETAKGEEFQFYMLEKEKAAEIILEYLEICRKYNIPHYLEQKYVDELINSLTKYGVKLYSLELLLHEYFKLKRNNNEELLESIMKKHNFNYKPSIRNSLYNLFGNPVDLIDRWINPILWPGVIQFNNVGNFYTIETEIGKIEVSKATSKFLKTSSAHILKKPLIQMCYARTYDFVKQNRNSYAILSKQPNFLYGYDYHAYVEVDGEILDISANAYYEKKEFSDKVLGNGQIAKLSFEEIIEELAGLNINEPEEKEKLYILSVYHDIKNRR